MLGNQQTKAPSHNSHTNTCLPLIDVLVLLGLAVALKGGVSPVVESVGTLPSCSESLDLPLVPGSGSLGPSTFPTALHQQRTCGTHTHETLEEYKHSSSVFHSYIYTDSDSRCLEWL